MATYSINTSSAYKSTFLGPLNANLFLNGLPNNTSQLIVPENVRNAVYTVWENVSFKPVSVSSSAIKYIGIDSKVHNDEYLSSGDGMKVYAGKKQLSGTNIMSDLLLGYSNTGSYSNSDFYFYNFKPDNFAGGSASQQFTKVSFLAGDNSNNLFLSAPYMLAQQNNSGTKINFTITNQAGKLTIDADELQIGSSNTPITLLYATGSTGVQTLPAGSIGDLQTNLDNCDFGFINGASASVGDVLIMGASNSPYWGDLSLDSVFTLNQILTSGNITNGQDIILSVDDYIYIGGTGSSYSFITHNDSYTLISASSSELRIKADTLKLEITGNGANKVLVTNASGIAEWIDQSSLSGGTSSISVAGNNGNIQYNNSGTLGATNNLTYNNTSLKINDNTSANYSLTVKSNANGSILVDSNNISNTLVINNNSSEKFRYNAPTQEFILTASSSTVYDVFYKNSSGVTASQISFSPKNDNGLFIGVSSDYERSLSLGFMTSNTILNSLLMYPQSYTHSLISQVTNKYPIIIGDFTNETSFTYSVTPGENNRSLGINTSPGVDFHLNGIEAIDTSQNNISEYTVTGSITTITVSYINNISTSNVILNINDNQTVGSDILHRIGDETRDQLAPYGTVIKLINTSATTITIKHLDSGAYSGYSKDNIYFPDSNTNALSGVAASMGSANFSLAQGMSIELMYIQGNPPSDPSGWGDAGYWLAINRL
jgi:hypothetical protein